ncbi:UNVERIFIED_CONTAM: hypothetical protein GTU68_039815, partial [Idotea baltica]|nr:hypothetical protein [Idotea baltica]
VCGIVGGIAERNLTPILLEGLRRLEYRGYDSSGIALLDKDGDIQRVRALGKIKSLQQKIDDDFPSFSGHIGIAHTRWATHGIPAENNAHPHICNGKVAVVHNGIIENYELLKREQTANDYTFTSETDTEVVAHEIHYQLQSHDTLFSAVKAAVKRFQGAYALGVMSTEDPDTLIAARKGSPLVIGIGIGEHFIASDVSALLPVTRSFIFLEEGDIAILTRTSITIFDADGQQVEREKRESNLSVASVELGQHRHYMHKEIYEQPQAVIDTLSGRTMHDKVITASFGLGAETAFNQIESVQIIACGTSYHAGLVAKYWFEDIAQLTCQVEVASEYRYRNPVINNKTLFITLSQSGETADTLAALQKVIEIKRTILAICNVAESSLTRESDFVCLTHAGPEIGVASTKAFTTQLVMLAALVTTISRLKGTINSEREKAIVSGLHQLPALITNVLSHEEIIEKIAEDFSDKQHALFLGR